MHISIEIMRIKPERNDKYGTHDTEKKILNFFFKSKYIFGSI